MNLFDRFLNFIFPSFMTVKPPPRRASPMRRANSFSYKLGSNPVDCTPIQNNYYNYYASYNPLPKPAMPLQYLHSYTEKLSPFEVKDTFYDRIMPQHFTYYINNRVVHDYEDILALHGLDINNLTDEDKLFIDMVTAQHERQPFAVD